MENRIPRVAVIMAGGSGERFWPLSRRKRPKQLLRLTSECETMLEEVVNRITPLFPPESIFIATSRVLAEPIRAAGLPIPPENVLAEPAKRNTAGCLCWVAAQLGKRFPGKEYAMAVLTADHRIGEPQRFREAVASALDAAERNDALVTIGIKPTRPDTGYGYIEAENSAPAGPPKPVLRFREKPDAETAKQFLEQGNFYWNSGMFFWRSDTFAAELAAASSVHASAIAGMRDALANNDDDTACRVFESLPDVSIDYALMEKAGKVLMVDGTFPWDDVGAWDALARSRTPDAEGNIVDGEAILPGTSDCIVVNDTGKRVAVGVAGAKNLIVVVTDDAVLVLPRGESQRVRDVVKSLKEKGAEQL